MPGVVRVLLVAGPAREGAQQGGDSSGQITGAGGEAFGEVDIGLPHGGDDPADGADAAFGAARGEPSCCAGRPRAAAAATAEASSCHRDCGDRGSDQSLGLLADRVGGHAYVTASSDSTRRLSSLSAVSMITFSALRLNIPSMPIARSTDSV